MPKANRGKRIALGILCALLAILVAVAVAVVVYVNNIDSKLGSKLEQSEVKSLLSNEIDGPFYILLVGTDSRDANQKTAKLDEVTGDNSDVIMLMRVDRDGKLAQILSVPRDTPWIDNSGNYQKLNTSYTVGGAAGIIAAVEQVSGVDVDHFANINFSDFEKMVDAVGGITVDVPVTVGYEDAFTGEYIEVPAGTQQLDGQHALILARARDEYGENQEMIRQGMVRTIMFTIFQKVSEKPVMELPGVLSDIAGCVSTDLKVGDIVSLGMGMRGDVDVTSASAPYEGDYIAALDDMWLCYEDKEGWAKVVGAMEAGTSIEDVSYSGDVARIPGTDQTVVIE